MKKERFSVSIISFGCFDKGMNVFPVFIYIFTKLLPRENISDRTNVGNYFLASFLEFPCCLDGSINNMASSLFSMVVDKSFLPTPCSKVTNSE